MKGRKCNQSNELKKKLTVTPFIPGAPIPINYCLYKLKKNVNVKDTSMYIPKHFSNEGELIENKVTFCNININGIPRDYQKEVINTVYKELVSKESCIACLYTGWGKTFASLYIASQLGVKTIILVNKETLLEQWKEQIIKFLGIKPGIIQGKVINTEPSVCIGMIQSISIKDYPDDTFNEFSLSIWDETHHYCSKVFSSAFYKIGSKYNLGLTATLKRADRLEYTLNWFLGDIAVDVQLLVIEPIIKVYTFYEHPDNTIKYLPNGKVNSAASITNVTEIECRVSLITRLIEQHAMEKRKILVLSDRKCHCEKIAHELKNKSHTVGLYYGGMKKDELSISNKCDIIIATYQMASEGYDNPELDTLVLASPKCNIEQAVGRILRKINKNLPVVIDVNDSISIFKNWNKKRLSFYNSKKFNIIYPEDKTQNVKKCPDLPLDYLFRDTCEI
tara:strand:- start:2622 stop:3965 length:1344 start_codon:yes stop_codon:yes gene_type:complete